MRYRCTESRSVAAFVPIRKNLCICRICPNLKESLHLHKFTASIVAYFREREFMFLRENARTRFLRENARTRFLRENARTRELDFWERTPELDFERERPNSILRENARTRFLRENARTRFLRENRGATVCVYFEFMQRSIPFDIHAKWTRLMFLVMPFEWLKNRSNNKITNCWSKQNAYQADARECEETKIRISKGKCIFRHDFPLPRLPLFFYLWESFLRRVSNFQEYATGKYEKTESRNK